MQYPLLLFTWPCCAFLISLSPSFETLGEFFEKNTWFMSAYLNPYSIISIRHLVSDICHEEETKIKSLEKDKIIWFTFFSDQLYIEKDVGKWKMLRHTYTTILLKLWYLRTIMVHMNINTFPDVVWRNSFNHSYKPGVIFQKYSFKQSWYFTLGFFYQKYSHSCCVMTQ